MKKKLKGLVALVLAVAMIVSIAPSSYAAVSDEIYNEITYPAMRVIADKDVSVAQMIEENGSFSMDDLDYTPLLASMGTAVSDPEKGFLPSFYEAEKWTIWEVNEEGLVTTSSRKKVVSASYKIDEEDYKQFGYGYYDSYEYARVKNPYIEATLVPTDYEFDIYDESGNNKLETLVLNVENYMDKELVIPEGYIGYMMTVCVVGAYTKYEDVFVTSTEDIWSEMEIMDCFEYAKDFSVIKLVPTKKLPYYVDFRREDNFDFDYNEYTYEDVIWLEPGESIKDNFSQIEELYPHYEIEGDEWEVWRVNYCGFAVETEVENTTIGLDIGTYLDIKFDALYRGDRYADIWYYERMYPVLVGCSYSPIEYKIPVYDMDGNLTDETVDFNVDNYDNLVNYENYPGYYFENQLDTEADGWVFEYKGERYTGLETTEDIWNILFATSNICDLSKAKLIAVSDNPVPQTIEIKSIGISNSVFTYTGSVITPEVTVEAIVNGISKTLTKDDDYTVTYTNNNKPGIATITVTGKGTYTGTMIIDFIIKPATVTNLKATSGEKKISLSWSAVTGATGYKVYASTNNGEFKYLGTTTKTSYTQSNLSDATKYSYKVVAYVNTASGDIDGEASTVAANETKTKLNAVKLTNTTYTYTGKEIKPEVKVTAKVNGKEVTLASTDYKIEYKNNKNPGIATVTITGKGNCYGTLTAQFTIKPNWVKNVKQVVASTYTKNLRISWSSVAGVTGYEVYKSNTKNGTYTLAGTTTKTEFTSKNLQPGTSYYYKVRAYKTVNGKKIYGSYSNVLKATTKTVAPSKVMTSVTSKKTNVKWYYSKGAVGYEVYMSTNAKYIGSKVATTTSSVKNVNLTGLKKGKTYYVRVRAYTTTATGTKMYTPFTSYVSFKAK